MNVRPASWSQPVDFARAALAALVATAVFAGAWTGLHYGFYARNHITDTPVYQRYGDAMVNGAVPYRDVTIEYPPGALPAFVVPSLIVGDGRSISDYDRVFGVLMAICGAALVGLVALTLVRDGAGTLRLVAGCGIAALAPLALGSVLLTRFDLWPAVLSVGALAALVSMRERLAFGVLGLGVAAKIYPLVLLPLFVVWTWRRRGRRRTAEGLGICALVVAACSLPFLAISPHGTWDSALRQLSRPLQIETLGSGFLLAAHQAFGLGITERNGYGSQNLVGRLPDTLSLVQAAIELVVIVGVWIWFARGPADNGRLFRASAASVCAFMIFGKVLSPQFLVWLVPLVALVRGRRGLASGLSLVGALVLTQLWFPYRYWALALEFDPLPSWLVLMRNLVLLALLALLLWPEPRPTRPRLGDRPSYAFAPEVSLD
jgi:hypothetical protein